jgi:hypothetical protein
MEMAVEDGKNGRKVRKMFMMNRMNRIQERKGRNGLAGGCPFSGVRAEAQRARRKNPRETARF